MAKDAIKKLCLSGNVLPLIKLIFTKPSSPLHVFVLALLGKVVHKAPKKRGS